MPTAISSGCSWTEVSNAPVLEAALELAGRAHHLDVMEVLRQLQNGNRAVHSSFRYGIAKALSGYLSELGTVFREIYVHGSATGEEANVASDIDVIVVVDRKRDVVIGLLRQVDLALTTRYRQLVGLGNVPRSLLDVDVVEQAEQAGHAGAVIGLRCGLHTRPICLWCSDPGSKGAPLPGSPRQYPVARAV